MNYGFKALLFTLIVILIVQCNLIDSNVDENEPTLFNTETLLNNIQLSTRNFYTQASELGGELTRMRYMFGDTYGSAYQPQSFNSIYENAYSQIFLDISNLRDMAELQDLRHHINIANILQAYTMIGLADVFGDVPFTETILGLDRLSPELDSADFIYDEAIALLTETSERLTNDLTGEFVNTDLYYGSLSNPESQKEAWARAANTIKLKAYLNTGNANAFNALVNSGDIIVENSQNFTFEYSASTQSAESRHPLFANNYVALANDYMANNYMNMLLNDKSDEFSRDPRIRYYFYRQFTDDPDPQLKVCVTTNEPSHFSSDDPYCHLDDGYWGRDHLISDGIPPDRGFRTVPGVYPAGGVYDVNQAEPVSQNMGFRGAGFDPILTAGFTHFMIAEAELTLNNNPDAARNHLEIALQKSFELVRDFSAGQAEGQSGELTPEKIDQYVTYVLNRYDSSNDDRLRTIAKEYYLALWPNGYEAYNLMRRTGYPNREDNLQPARTSSPGNWYRTFLYPAVLVNRNANATQKPTTLTRTFWDVRGEDDEFNF